MNRPSVKRRFGRFWRFGWYLLAVALVLLALLVGTLSRLLPLAERNPDRVAAWLSEQSGRTVRFDALQTEWTRRGPLLRVDGLRVGDGPDPVQVGEAEILLSQYGGLIPGRALTELRLRGLELTLERDAQGQWQVRGLPGQRDNADPFSALEMLGELQVVDASITVLAPDWGIERTIPQMDIRLQVNGRNVRAAARGRLPGDSALLQFSTGFDRETGDGRAWLDIDDLEFAEWANLLHYAGVSVEGGSGDLTAWARLQARRVSSMTADFDLRELAFSGTSSELPSKQSRFEAINGRLMIEADGRNWRIDAPRLQIASNGVDQRLDGALVAWGERFALEVESVELAPFLRLVSLSDRLRPNLERWLYLGEPSARLEAIHVAGNDGGALMGSATLADSAAGNVGEWPGARGLRGGLRVDAGGVALDLDADAVAVFDWQSGFAGELHPLSLSGEVLAWPEDEGRRWHVQTPALRVDGDGYGADLRGGLLFQRDGSRPRIDLAVAVDDLPVSRIKRFWVRHHMSEEAIEWLDHALVDGMARDGSAVLAGDLDHWPFRLDEQGLPIGGILMASANVEDARLQFHPDWPQAHAVSGQVTFLGDGMSGRGTASSNDVSGVSFRLSLPHFRQSMLELHAEGQADAGALQALLRATPINDNLGSLLSDFSSRGRAGVSMTLRYPLGDGRAMPEVEGRAVLQGVDLRHDEWDLQLGQAQGDASFDRHGFTAVDLEAEFDGWPVMVSARAGDGHVGSPGNVFEADASARLAVDGLLDRVAALHWLQPHLAGESEWSLSASVPGAQVGGDEVARLRFESDLIGTAVGLPAPLRKPAAVAQPTRIEVTLPFTSSLVEVDMGDRMRLAARVREQGPPGLAIALGARVALPEPEDGVTLAGGAPEIDLAEWFGALPSGEGEGMLLRDLSLEVGRLHFAGATFEGVSVTGRDDAAAGQTVLRLAGEDVAGVLAIANDSSRAVHGELDRLHWRTASADADTRTDEAPGGDTVDPATIPALDLKVADLQVGQMRLGSADIRTRPSDGGLSIEHLRLQADAHALSMQGQWHGRGEASRMQVHVDLESQDMGELLRLVEQGNRMTGGHGRLRLDGAWPGGPGAFNPRDLEGRLSIRIDGGQLVDIEPGAGRVLGLLSVAELPRRLAFDFRDFFDKGFAFTTISGDILFGSGVARGEGLAIDAPAARINIGGSADLAAQTYDQVIDVHPKSGNLLTAVGAFTAGPVGAAIGAMTNELLKRPLGEIGATRYHVTGPWSEPVVDVVARNLPPVALEAGAESGELAQDPP